MATVPALPVAYPVALAPGAGGQLVHTLPPGAAWTLESLSFTVDLSASGTADDVLVRILDQSGVLICGACPGAGQQPGDVMTYTLAQDLNPCDGIVNPFLNLSPDTFTPLTLVEGCQVYAEARQQGNGALDSQAIMGDGVAWVTSLGAGLGADIPPLLVPIPLGSAVGAVGV